MKVRYHFYLDQTLQLGILNYWIKALNLDQLYILYKIAILNLLQSKNQNSRQNKIHHLLIHSIKILSCNSSLGHQPVTNSPQLKEWNYRHYRSNHQKNSLYTLHLPIYQIWLISNQLIIELFLPYLWKNHPRFHQLEGV